MIAKFKWFMLAAFTLKFQNWVKTASFMSKLKPSPVLSSTTPEIMEAKKGFLKHTKARYL